MADRLAARRAQQQGGGGYGGGNDYSYNSGGGYGGGGGGGGRYGQQQEDSNRYEMSNINGGGGGYGGGYGGGNNAYGGGGGYGAPVPAAGDMNAFWDEVSSIQTTLRQFNESVARISDLHARSLNNMGDESVQDSLERTINDTRALSNDLKKRIKALQAQGGDSRDGQTRRQQAALLKTKFQEAIQNYQQVEQRHRAAQKQRMERQYRIVNPNAGPDEVRAAVDSDNPGQVFQQALMNSNRLGESRATYREVQERHQDIQKIEQTIAELAQLFNDMAILVEEQGEQVKVIEQTTQNVEQDTEAAYVHTEKAKESALSARKKRWICFAIVVIILIIVAIVIGIQFAQGNLGNKAVSGGNNNGNTVTVTNVAPAATTALAAPTPSATAPRLRFAREWS